MIWPFSHLRESSQLFMTMSVLLCLSRGRERRESDATSDFFVAEGDNASGGSDDVDAALLGRLSTVMTHVKLETKGGFCNLLHQRYSPRASYLNDSSPSVSSHHK
jgi:hypothetical protein